MFIIHYNGNFKKCKSLFKIYKELISQKIINFKMYGTKQIKQISSTTSVKKSSTTDFIEYF